MYFVCLMHSYWVFTAEVSKFCNKKKLIGIYINLTLCHKISNCSSVSLITVRLVHRQLDTSRSSRHGGIVKNVSPWRVFLSESRFSYGAVTAASPQFEKSAISRARCNYNAFNLACGDFGLCRELVPTVLEKCSHIVQVMSRGF